MFINKNKNIHVILGNGPSLDGYRTIKNATVWGINRIFLAPIKVDNYLALDRHLWRFEGKRIEQLKATKYYLPERYKDLAEIAIHQHKIKTFTYAEKPTDFLKDNKIGHGYTSVFATIQLAILDGATEIQFFGVDFASETNRSHFYGLVQRSPKFWTLGKKSFLIALNKLDELGIKFKVNSHLFNRDISKQKEAI